MLPDARDGDPGAVADAEIDRASAPHPEVVVGLDPHGVRSVLHQRSIQFETQGRSHAQQRLRSTVEEDVDSVTRPG